MGVVYLGFDPAIKRQVAIKTILIQDGPGSLGGGALFDALVSEARAAGGMAHPGIVTMHQLGVEDGLIFPVMEYLPGGSLDNRLQVGVPVHPPWSTHILQQIESALDFAHAAGFVHRDIKPGNILLVNPRLPGTSTNQLSEPVKVADFGLARAIDANQSSRGIAGTPNYLSPEQINGQRLDGRSDQFALAAMSYRLLTGRMPLTAETIEALLMRILMAEPPVAHQVNPRQHPHVHAVLIKCMAKAPPDRFVTCAEFVAALKGALAGQMAPSQPAMKAIGLVGGAVGASHRPGCYRGRLHFRGRASARGAASGGGRIAEADQANAHEADYNSADAKVPARDPSSRGSAAAGQQ